MRAFAKENDLDTDATTDQADLVLSACGRGLTLKWYLANGSKKKSGKPLEFYIDIEAFLAQQKSFPAPKQGAFNQALGKSTRTIIDATAGWGSDALLMCSQGYSVSMIERNPLMALLLEDAMLRLSKSSWVERHSVSIPKLIRANAIDWFKTGDAKADCVYLDPMFPGKRKKSAAVNKNMQLLQWLVGPDHDAGDLLGAALDTNCIRVAVKRPDYASPLLVQRSTQIIHPTSRFSSKLVHYDVYF